MKIETILAPNPGAFTLDGTRTYVLDRSFVIDPGPSIASHVDAIAERLANPRAVLLTHRHADHVPAAVDLRQKLQMEIWGPPGVGVDLDRTLREGDMVELGSTALTVLETPGHTAEHVCYLSADGDLFTGDMVLGEGTTVVLPPDGDMGAYIRSLQRLRTLDVSRVWPGHGPVREDVADLLEGYIAHRRQRETQIVNSLRADSQSISGLRATIYPDVDPRLHGAAESQIEAHLIDLQARGLVRRDGEHFLYAGRRS